MLVALAGGGDRENGFSLCAFAVFGYMLSPQGEEIAKNGELTSARAGSEVAGEACCSAIGRTVAFRPAVGLSGRSACTGHALGLGTPAGGPGSVPQASTASAMSPGWSPMGKERVCEVARAEDAS